MIAKLDIDPPYYNYYQYLDNDTIEQILKNIRKIAKIEKVEFSMRKGLHVIAKVKDYNDYLILNLAFSDNARLTHDMKRLYFERDVLFNMPPKIIVKEVRT
jgi:predicted nucleic acid-binding protein